MIPYINKRMIDWATWSMRGKDAGLGYPRKSTYCSLVPIRGGEEVPVVPDAAAWEIERIIVKLRADRPEMYQVAYWVYLAGSLTMNRVAQELGCCRDTVYTRLHSLHLHVMDALHDD